MKKGALVVLLLLAFSAAFGAEDDAPPRGQDGNFIYQEVVQVDGETAAALYAKAKEWIARAYRSAKDVIQLDDKEGGKIIAKGAIKAFQKVLLVPHEKTITHTLTIEVKDGRYRYSFDSLGYVCNDGSITGLENRDKNKGPLVGYKSLLKSTHLEFLSLIESLKAAMAVKKTEEKW